MKIKYAHEAEENLWLCFYKADGFELVKPVDATYPSSVFCHPFLRTPRFVPDGQDRGGARPLCGD